MQNALARYRSYEDDYQELLSRFKAGNRRLKLKTALINARMRLVAYALLLKSRFNGAIDLDNLLPPAPFIDYADVEAVYFDKALGQSGDSSPYHRRGRDGS
jgi:hypothetical protein